MADDDGFVTITDRWCLTEDQSRVVLDTDPEARWLHWRPGDRVPLEEAQRLGAAKRKPGRPPGSGTKKAAPDEDKAAKPDEDKGGLSIQSRPRRA
jgi:hypothetical protein